MRQLDLTKFKVYLFGDGGVIRIKISEKAVFFTTFALAKIGAPDYVKVFINEQDKQVAFKPAQKNEENAIRLYKQSGGGAHVKPKGLLIEIARVIGCDVANLDIRVYGIEFNGYLVFDLKTGNPWKKQKNA